MTSVRGRSPILDSYLAELDAATAHLPTDEAYETRASIEEHLADSFPAPGRIDDDAARRVIRDLGPVSTIVPPRPASEPAIAGAGSPSSAAPAGRMGYLAAGCGVAGIVLFPLVPIGIALGLTALVLGVLAVRNHQQRGFAAAGLVLGSIAGIVIPVLFIGVYTSTEDGGGPGSSTQVTSYSAPPAHETP